MYYSSPLGVFMYAFSILESIPAALGYYSQMAVPFSSWLPVIILIIAALTFITYYLYKKRKAEDVSNPFVYKILYHIVITLITFDILAFIMLSDDMAVILIIFSIIVYFLFDIVRKRGFKKLYKTALTYLATACATMLVMGIVYSTNFFGIEAYIPSKDSVKNVEISMVNDIITNDYTDVDFITADKEFIEDVTELHKEIYQQYVGNSDTDEYEYDSYYNQVISIEITYKLNSGKTVAREYDITFQDFQIIKSLYQNRDYINSLIEYWERILETSDTISIGSKLTVGNENFNRYDIKGTDFKDEFIKAYKADRLNQTIDDFFAPDDVYAVMDFYGKYVSIPTSFTNTISVLEHYEVTPNDVAEDAEAFFAISGNSVKLYDASKYTSFNDEQYTASFGSFKAEKVSIITKDNPYLEQLIEVGVPYYFTTDDCFVFDFDGARYVVPKKYEDIARKAMENASEQQVSPDNIPISERYEIYESYYAEYGLDIGYEKYYDDYYSELVQFNARFGYDNTDWSNDEQENWYNYFSGNDY